MVNYREKTGKCETCGAPLNNHPTCAACDVLCGIGHLASLCHYRGHDICGYCVQNWKTLDKTVGRRTTWEEFHSPKLKLFGQSGMMTNIFREALEILESRNGDITNEEQELVAAAVIPLMLLPQYNETPIKEGLDELAKIIEEAQNDVAGRLLVA